jgi:hypothetical protein
MIFDDVKARVFAGAAFLDAALGTKWTKKVDAERLAISNGEACILGQVFGDYSYGIDELELIDADGNSLTMARTLGFEQDKDNAVTYDLLDQEWKKLLRNRKRQATRKKHTLRVPIV